MLNGTTDSTKSPSSTQTNTMNKQRKQQQVSSNDGGPTGADDPVESSDSAPPMSNGGNPSPPTNISVYKKPPGTSSGGRSRAGRSMAKKQKAPSQKHNNRPPPMNIEVYSNQRNGLPPPPQQQQLNGPPPSAINVYTKQPAIPQSIVAFNNGNGVPMSAPSPTPQSMGVDATSSVGAHSTSSAGGMAANVGMNSMDNSSHHTPMPPATYQFNHYQQQPALMQQQQQFHNMYQQPQQHMHPHPTAIPFQNNSSAAQPLPPSTNTAFPPAPKGPSPTAASSSGGAHGAPFAQMSNEQQQQQASVSSTSSPPQGANAYSTMQQQQQQFSLYQQHLQQQQQQLQQQLQHNLQQQQLHQQLQQQHQLMNTGPNGQQQVPMQMQHHHHGGAVPTPHGPSGQGGPLGMMAPGPNGMIPNHPQSGSANVMMMPGQHQQQQPYMPGFAAGVPQPPHGAPTGAMGGGMMMHQQQQGVPQYQNMHPHQYQQQPFPMVGANGAPPATSPANSIASSPMTMMNSSTPNTVVGNTSAVTGASSVTATTVMTSGVTTATGGGLTPSPHQAPKSAGGGKDGQSTTSAGTQRRRRKKKTAASDSSYSSKQKEYHLTVDYIPGQFDIVIGRHKNAYNHLGNRRFRVTILLFLPQYIERPQRKERTTLIMKMVELIRANGGHFVKWDDTRNCWMDIGDKQARNKVGHALRDAACVRAGGGSVSEISSLASGGTASFAPSAGSTSNADLLDVTPLISPEDAGLLPSSNHVPSAGDSVTTGGTSITNRDDDDEDDFDEDEDDDGDDSSVDIEFSIDLDGHGRQRPPQQQTDAAREGLLAQWRNGHRRARRRRSDHQQHLLSRGEGKDDQSTGETSHTSNTTGSRAAASAPSGMIPLDEDAAVPTTIQSRNRRNISAGSVCSKGSAGSGRSRASGRSRGSSHNSSVSGNKRRKVKTVVISGLSTIDASSASSGSQREGVTPTSGNGRKRIATANRGIVVSSSGRPRSSARHTTNAVCDGSDDENVGNDYDDDDDHPMQPMVTMKTSPSASGPQIQQQQQGIAQSMAASENQSGAPMPAVNVRGAGEMAQQTNASANYGYQMPTGLPQHHNRDGAGVPVLPSSNHFNPSYNGGIMQHMLPPSFIPPKPEPRHSPSQAEMPPPPASAPMMESSDDESLFAQQRFGHQQNGSAASSVQSKRDRRKGRKQRGAGATGVESYYGGEIGLSSDDDMFDHKDTAGAIDYYDLAEMAKGTNEAWGGVSGVAAQSHLAASAPPTASIKANDMNGSNLGFVSSPLGTGTPRKQHFNGISGQQPQAQNGSDPSPPSKSSDDSNATPITANVQDGSPLPQTKSGSSAPRKNGANCVAPQMELNNGNRTTGVDPSKASASHHGEHHHLDLHHHHVEEQHWNMHVMDMLVPAFHNDEGVEDDDAMALARSDVDEFMTCPSDKEL